MKIYGEANIRMSYKVGEVLAKEFNDGNSPIGFIKEHGMLGEYISKMERFDNGEYEIDTDPKNVDMHKVEYNGEIYWYGCNSLDMKMQLKLNHRIGFYKELPNIYDDNVFKWKKNKKYGTMECTIEEDVLEYQVIYKPDGNANINVKYIACDNLHKNKVTMATIEVVYASNDVILEAIKTWKKQFAEMIACA